MKNLHTFLLIICLILFLSYSLLFSQTIVIQGGKFITMTQGIIDDGMLLIREGKIVDISKNFHIPDDAKIIDASGCIILPGFIDCFTNLGTADIESFGCDDDEATSPVTPHLKIIDALNPENSFIPLVRKRGITTVLCAPAEGNLISGQSGLIHLYGSSVEEMIIKFPIAIHASLGEIPKLRYGKKNQYPSTRMGEAALLRQTLIETSEYLNKIKTYVKRLKEYKKGKDKNSQEKPTPPETDLKLQALIPVLEKKLPIIVSANRLDDILTALRIADEFNLNLIINKGAEAYKVADKLAAKNIPVIIGPVASYQQRLETKGAIYENAYKLHTAGVKIAFQTGSVQNFADLLYQAETAVSYGLPYEEALKALTYYPAQIFKVDKMLGSLEKDKLADIIIFEKNPLKSLARVKTVIIKGGIIEKL